MNMKFRTSALLMAATFLAVFQSMEAQVVTGGLAGGLPSASAASYYYVSKPGELTMQVNVWGYVHNPGRYEVPTSTDLIQLLSFAGGPIQDAKLDEVKVTRFLKRDTGISRGEFFVNLEDLSKVDQAKLVLYPGDTIYMTHTSWVNLRDVFTVISTLAIVTTAVSQVYIASTYRR
jgi:SLBB domain